MHTYNENSAILNIAYSPESNVKNICKRSLVYKCSWKTKKTKQKKQTKKQKTKLCLICLPELMRPLKEEMDKPEKKLLFKTNPSPKCSSTFILGFFSLPMSRL